MTIETTLENHLRRLEKQHGGVRPAARALGVHPSYWIRLRNGAKSNPSDDFLNKLGLERRVFYVEKK